MPIKRAQVYTQNSKIVTKNNGKTFNLTSDFGILYKSSYCLFIIMKK